MHSLFDYLQDECPWYYFDSSYKTLLGACLILFGVFGVLLNGWLFATFIHSHLLIFKSHILVLNLCSASLGRNLLGFPFSGASALAKRWLFGSACCQLFAFLNQFLGVFQMAALLAIVLERYLQAKFYRHEKSLYLRLYWTLIGICWLSSVVFATPPLFGYGVYSCDPTGTSCSLLWPSFHSGMRHIGFSVPYVIVCGLIPIVAIFYYMGKAVRLEKIYYRSEQQREQKSLTRSVHTLCVATLAFWIPAGIVSGWQWLPLLTYGYRPHVHPALALIATISSELICLVSFTMFGILLFSLLGDKKTTEECVWKLYFDDFSRTALHIGLAFTGLISLALNCWLNLSVIMTSLWNDLSYRNLSVFVSIAAIRKVSSAMAYIPAFKLIDRIVGSDLLSCSMFAFYETFLAILEVESLTHVCIERFVVARYNSNGWPVQTKHYILYLCSSMFCAGLYAYLPLLGYGGYWYDFSCTTCTYDMVLPKANSKYVVLAIFLLRSVKPVLIMILTLFCARCLETRSGNVAQGRFTKNVIMVVLVNLICWTPIAIIRSQVLFEQLINDKLILTADSYIIPIKWAMWLHWLAPAFTAVTLFLHDDVLRKKMLNPREEELALANSLRNRKTQ